MAQQDYEQKKRECWVQFCKDNGIEQEVNICIFDAFDQIFDRAYALGKQEKVADTVIQGWVARDKNGLLSLFRLYRPERGYDYDGEFGEWGTSIGYQMTIPNRLFPDITWESDPEPVEIIIKRKKRNL